MSTSAVTPDQNQIQGLPPGAVVKAIGTQTGVSAPQASQIEGLPPGAVVKPVGQAGSSASDTGIPAAAQISEDDKGASAGLRRTLTGVTSLPGNLWHAATTPAQDEAEQQSVKALTTLSGHVISEPLALMIHRLVIAPAAREHDLALAYEKIARSKGDNSGMLAMQELADKNPEEFARQQAKIAGKQMLGIAGGPVGMLIENQMRPDVSQEQHMANVHHIASLVPILGPAAANLVEHYEQGDKSGAVSELLSGIGMAWATGKLSKAAGKQIAKVAPKQTTIAGENTTVMAGQEKGAAPIAQKVASAPTPNSALAETQQAAAQQGVKNVASDALNQQIEKMQGEPRYAYRSRDVGEQGVPNVKSASQAGTSEDEIRGYMEHRENIQGAPQELVRVNLDKLKPEDFTLQPRGEGKQPWVKFNRPLTEAEVEAAPNNNGEFAKPAPPPPAQASSFGDAAAQTKAVAQTTFKKLDQLSDNAFSTYQNRYRMATAAERRATTVEDMEKAQAARADAQKNIDDLIQQHQNNFKPNELQNAQSAWRDMQVLDDVHGYVEKAFSAPADVAAKSNLVSRTLDGKKLIDNLNTMTQKVPAADLERVLGKDGLKNLYEIGKLASDAQGAAKVTSAMDEVGGYLGKTVKAPMDVRNLVMRGIATHPRAGFMLLNALNFGTRPAVYAPLIGAEIQKMNDDQDMSVASK